MADPLQSNMPRRRDPGPQSVSFEDAQKSHKPSLRDFLRQRKEQGIGTSEAIMEAADAGLIHPKMAEKYLGMTGGADLLDGQAPQPAQQAPSTPPTPAEIQQYAAEGQIGPDDAQILRRELPRHIPEPGASSRMSPQEIQQYAAQGQVGPAEAEILKRQLSRHIPPPSASGLAPEEIQSLAAQYGVQPGEAEILKRQLPPQLKGIDPATLAALMRQMGR